MQYLINLWKYYSGKYFVCSRPWKWIPYSSLCFSCIWNLYDIRVLYSHQSPAAHCLCLQRSHDIRSSLKAENSSPWHSAWSPSITKKPMGSDFSTSLDNFLYNDCNAICLLNVIGVQQWYPMVTFEPVWWLLMSWHLFGTRTFATIIKN